MSISRIFALEINDDSFYLGFSPYNCDSCPQKFVRKDRYVVHLTTHNLKYKEDIHGELILKIAFIFKFVNCSVILNRLSRG
jgi:hypothetical protein